MSVVILIRPVWKHGPRSLVWMRDFGNLNSLIVGNLDRVYLMNQIYSRAVFFPSKSIYTGTRKMVNYTCAGLSQEKFCWRSEAILTCKSFVGYRYRGERLIELSSSWFPPKFPLIDTHGMISFSVKVLGDVPPQGEIKVASAGGWSFTGSPHV